VGGTVLRVPWASHWTSEGIKLAEVGVTGDPTTSKWHAICGRGLPTAEGPPPMQAIRPMRRGRSSASHLPSPAYVGFQSFAATIPCRVQLVHDQDGLNTTLALRQIRELR
jgi:hypothetical protein